MVDRAARRTADALLEPAPWARRSRRVLAAGAIFAILLLAACGGSQAPPLAGTAADDPAPEYKIETGDSVHIFVWRAPDLSVTVPVRPDGRISMPLVPDMPAAGKTSEQLAKDVTQRLTTYMQDPVVTVMVDHFGEPVDQQVRVLGEVLRPVAVGWKPDMTALDALIQVGGLTQFAAGNRAVLVRKTAEGQKTYHLRLDDLVRDGDVSANIPLQPGDEIIVPRSWF